MMRAITIVYTKCNWGGERKTIKLNKNTKNGLIMEVILKLVLEKLVNYFQLRMMKRSSCRVSIKVQRPERAW